jgi:hypothetical protein
MTRSSSKEKGQGYRQIEEERNFIKVELIEKLRDRNILVTDGTSQKIKEWGWITKPHLLMT